MSMISQSEFSGTESDTGSAHEFKAPLQSKNRLPKAGAFEVPQSPFMRKLKSGETLMSAKGSPISVQTGMVARTAQKKGRHPPLPLTLPVWLLCERVVGVFLGWWHQQSSTEQAKMLTLLPPPTRAHTPPLSLFFSCPQAGALPAGKAWRLRCRLLVAKWSNWKVSPASRK
jgi:hypothetical protein